MKTNDFSEFERMIAYGILPDYYNALRHYKCFKKINDNVSMVKETSLHPQELYSYIQNSSLQLCILHLTRIFDKPNDNEDSRTRSLPAIMHDILSQDKPVKLKKFHEHKWRKFLLHFSSIIESHTLLNTKDYDIFLLSFNELLDSLISKGSIISRLRLLRNKRIAHNTSYATIITLKNEEIELLLNLVKLFLEIINDFVLTNVVFNIPLVSTSHLDTIVPKTKKQTKINSSFIPARSSPPGFN